MIKINLVLSLQFCNKPLLEIVAYDINRIEQSKSKYISKRHIFHELIKKNHI